MMTRCCSISIILIVILYMIPAPQNVNNDNLRSGQASSETSNYVNHPDTDDHIDSIEIAQAHQDIEAEEQDMLATTQKYLSYAVSTAGVYVKMGMNQLLGNAQDLTPQDIEEMAQEVQQQLQTETNQQLQAEADRLVESEEEKLDEQVQEDEDELMPADEIRQDLAEQEDLAVAHVRQEMDRKAEAIAKQLEKRAQEIEIEILEKRLEEKLGHKVKVVVMEDEIQSVEGLLEGLPNLGGKAPEDTPPELVRVMDNGMGMGGADGVVNADGGGNGFFDEDDDGDYQRKHI